MAVRTPPLSDKYRQKIIQTVRLSVSVLNFSPCDAPVERLGCRRLGDLLGFGFGFGFGLCFALGGDSGGGQIGGLLGGGIVR